MSLIALTEVILTVLALVAIGVALRATGLLSFEDAKPLNTIIIYVGLPALVFQAVRGAELGIDLGAGLRLGTFELLVVYEINRFTTYRFLGLDDRTRYNWDSIMLLLTWAFPTG